MNEACQITLGVPVYKGAEFLKETLKSIQAQTFRNFQVIISLDGPDEESTKICKEFLRDSRFRMVTQNVRKGWVGNINWLMEQVDTPFWCYYQQDDLTDPRYLEVLLEAARREPDAAVVYCDIVAFGTQSWKMSQPSVTGVASTRQLALLYGHHSAVAFRGLTRRQALKKSGGIITNEVENFSVDTTWMSGVAMWGELIRVPGYLYLKRYHEDNTHTKWTAWPREKLNFAWLVHCADMLQFAMKVSAHPKERRLLWLATINRLTSPRVAAGYIKLPDLTPQLRQEMLSNFLHYLEHVRKYNLPTWLESSWDDLAIWTRGFYS